MLSWEASAYFRDSPKKAGWWDRLSAVFRGDAMHVRMQIALDLLRPHLAGKTVMDVGCGSGRFAFQMSEAGVAKVIQRVADGLFGLEKFALTRNDEKSFDYFEK